MVNPPKNSKINDETEKKSLKKKHSGHLNNLVTDFSRIFPKILIRVTFQTFQNHINFFNKLNSKKVEKKLNFFKVRLIKRNSKNKLINV